VAVLVALSVAFVVVAFAFGPRAGTATGGGAPRALPTAAAASHSASVSAVIEQPVSPAPSAAKRPRSAHALPVKSSEASRNVRPDPSGEADQFGTLRITADPRAVVEVSGPNFHEQRQTPVLGLKVPSGKYQIVFRSDTIGTPVNAQVMVVAGASRSVHADFRQAEPAVSVR
jgi:hypothetical protein